MKILKEYIQELLIEGENFLSMYHGTYLHNLKSILQKGLKAFVPHGAPHGHKGVYLTGDIQLAARYAFGEVPVENAIPIILEVILQKKKTKKLIYDPLDRHSMWSEDSSYEGSDVDEATRLIEKGYDNIFKKYSKGERIPYNLRLKLDFNELEDMKNYELYKEILYRLMKIFPNIPKRQLTKDIMEEFPPGHFFEHVEISNNGTIQIDPSYFQGIEQSIYPNKDLSPKTIRYIWVRPEDFPNLDESNVLETKKFGKKELPGEAIDRHNKITSFLNNLTYISSDDNFKELAYRSEEYDFDDIAKLLYQAQEELTNNGIADPETVSEIQNAASDTLGWLESESWGEEEVSDIQEWVKVKPSTLVNQLGTSS